MGNRVTIYDKKVAADCTLPILTSSKTNGIEYQSDHFGREQNHDIDGYNVLPRGYATYRNRSDNRDFTFNINNICDEGIISKFYPVFTSYNCDLIFLIYLLNNSPSIVKEIGYTAIGTGQKVLSISDFKSIKVFIPDIKEQQKIADFLSAVDEVIAQSEAEAQNLEQQKKAAMQKIFSQEVRFKREDGTKYPEWEEDTIGNCVNVTSCKRVHQSDWTDSGVPFYRAREIVALYNNEPITPLHISIEKYNALSKISGMISSGDLLVTGVGTIGVPYLVKESDKFYFKDGNIIWFQNEEKRALGSFLYYTLSTNEFQTKILQDSGKGTVHTFTIANAKETIIAIPCLEEQRKIADFLSAYDEAISYAKQELDKWKELKKGLLQQMFV